ncbi:hypothetical protein FRC01_007682 [Tulasnella sp. 417]|nr:hypothetical protein FRC01_007682 [Tulasnella sp. 417]
MAVQIEANQARTRNASWTRYAGYRVASYNLRNFNNSDASLVTPSTITAPPPRTGPGLPRRPTQQRQPSFFYSFPNTPTRSRVDLTKTFCPANQPTGPFLTAGPSGSGRGGGGTAVGSPDMEADLNDEWGGLPRGNITAPASSRWESLFRRFKNRLGKVWEGVNEFMTVPMWAALLSLIVATHGSSSRREGDDRDARQKSESHWNSSELSIATLTDNIREAIKLRVGGYKKLGSPTASKRELREQLARKGDGRTMFVAIVSRMLLAPALVLPAVAALAYWDLQRVTDDPVFVVSMVLLVSSPPAMTLAQITQAASGDAFERLISKTIFWSYCIFTPPLTIVYVVIGLILSNM